MRGNNLTAAVYSFFEFLNFIFVYAPFFGGGGVAIASYSTFHVSRRNDGIQRPLQVFVDRDALLLFVQFKIEPSVE